MEKYKKEICHYYISLNEPDKHLKFIIYYKVLKISNLVITNNVGPQKSPCVKIMEFMNSRALWDVASLISTMKKKIKFFHRLRMHYILSWVDLSLVENCQFMHISVSTLRTIKIK